MAPLLTAAPVMRVWALRTLRDAPAWLVREPAIWLGPLIATVPWLSRLPVSWPNPLRLPLGALASFGAASWPPDMLIDLPPALVMGTLKAIEPPALAMR